MSKGFVIGAMSISVPVLVLVAFQNCGVVGSHGGSSASQSQSFEKVAFSEDFDDGDGKILIPEIPAASAFKREDRYMSKIGDLTAIHEGCAPCSGDAGPGGFALSETGGVSGSRALQLSTSDLRGEQGIRIDPTKKYRMRLAMKAEKTFLPSGHDAIVFIEAYIISQTSSGDEAYPQSRRLQVTPTADWQNFEVNIDPLPGYVGRKYELFFVIRAWSPAWRISIDNISIEDVT